MGCNNCVLHKGKAESLPEAEAPSLPVVSPWRRRLFCRPSCITIIVMQIHSRDMVYNRVWVGGVRKRSQTLEAEGYALAEIAAVTSALGDRNCRKESPHTKFRREAWLRIDHDSKWLDSDDAPLQTGSPLESTCTPWHICRHIHYVNCTIGSSEDLRKLHRKTRKHKRKHRGIAGLKVDVSNT